MKKIYIATDKEHLCDEENHLFSTIISEIGHSPELLVWDDDKSDANSCDCLFIRSCWNYHEKSNDFVNWINSLKVPVINSKNTILWNIHKRYLLQLKDANIKIPSTFVINNKNIHLFDFSALKTFVIKPAISASGNLTYKFDQTNINKIQSILPLYSGDILIQEYIPEITTEGEISFVFFNNKFSHAVKKIPSPMDFRSQTRHGGRVEKFVPKNSLLEQANSIIQKITTILPEIPFYTRLDVVSRGGTLIVMEVELIEPRLFLSASNCEILKKEILTILS